MIQKYTGWEMYSLESAHRNDGHVYVKWADVEQFIPKAVTEDKITEFPADKIVRIPVNSPHDCNDPSPNKPPPFRNQKCTCAERSPSPQTGKTGDERA